MPFAEFECLERFDCAQEATDPGSDLCGRCKVERSAHFIGHGFGEIANALLVFFDNTTEQREPFFAACLAESLESGLGGLHGRIDVRLRSKRDLGARLFGRGTDDQMTLAAD